MRRLTKTERAAATAVLAMAATVACSGAALLKKHARLLAQRAAARFDGEAADETASEKDEKQAGCQREKGE